MSEPTFEMVQGSVVLGCSHCRAITTFPEFIYIEGGSDQWFCPSCGHPVRELGHCPVVTAVGEEFYLTDGERMLGPHPTVAEAEASLWAWFGG
jgi:hypothetical protein